MRVLLDENLPHDLISELGGHEVVTVQGLGWAGVKNGELLRRAAGQVDAFLTMDRKLEDEHDLTALSFGVVVIRARSNRVQDLRPLIGAAQAVVDALVPVNKRMIRDEGAGLQVLVAFIIAPW